MLLQPLQASPKSVCFSTIGVCITCGKRVSSTACRREWIFRHRSSDDVPDVCPEGGGVQQVSFYWRATAVRRPLLSVTLLYVTVSHIIYWAHNSKSFIINNLHWSCFTPTKTVFLNLFGCFEMCSWPFGLRGSVLKAVISFSLITLIVLNENAKSHKSQSWIPFVVIISSISAFTDWINQKEEFVKLRNTSSTTVSSEVVPELKPTTTGFPDNPQSTAADSQHLSTTPKESDSKNEKVM